MPTTRRTVLAQSMGAALGLLTLNGTRALGAPADAAEACVLVWLQGGPSHLDTFDPKPGARTGGGVKGISTAVPGLQLAEHFPRLAERAKRLAVIRSLTSREGDHARATYLVRTGYAPAGTLRHPTWGAVVANELQARPALPSFVRLGTARADPIGPGFLGAARAAFQPGVALTPSGGLTPARRRGRRELLRALERPFLGRHGLGEGTKATSPREGALAEAEQVLNGPLRKCLALEGESQATRARYGPANLAFLQARRLLQAGVRCVEVVVDGWDDHEAIEDRLPGRARNLDRGLAALLDELAAEGRLRKTLVLCLGEFGRTPDVNARGGRDHYPRAFSALLAGGGLQVGRAIGKTDPEGRSVIERPLRIPDLLATVATRLGIDPAARRYAGERPVTVVDGGKPIRELLG
jgi:uncharacterized protein (DUF1501 family)